MTRIAVTGGTGSFGRQFLADTFVRCPEATLVVISRDEVKQGDLLQRYPDRPGEPGARLRCFLGDVRDRERLTQAFVGCDVVVHAAALKRADLTAYAPEELLRTNVLGTVNVVHAAVQCRVPLVVMLSTDKAGGPTPYGISKAMAEFCAIQSNTYAWPQGTRVVCTRYGNVAFSRGSVLETWRARLTAGQPLLLTDSGCSRFWMSLAQAVELVHVAIREAIGGEIFVPMMRALDLLSTVIAMGGPDVEVIETGLRVPVERIHETLATPAEMARALTRHDDRLGEYYVIPSAYNTWGAKFSGTPPSPWLRTQGITSDTVSRFSIEAFRQFLREVEA